MIMKSEQQQHENSLDIGMTLNENLNDILLTNIDGMNLICNTVNVQGIQGKKK